METKQGNVLVVDDNEMNREVLARRLERQGYGVTMAEDGQRALELVQTGQFDLILLDIMMPRVNGYQVLEHIKADARLRATPVIVISAVDELDSIVKCIELGAEDYLFKPFNPVLLKARISAVMNRRDILNPKIQEVESLLEDAKKALGAVLAGEAGPLGEAQAVHLKKTEMSIVQALNTLTATL
jgi:adenylate cyclase